MVMNYSVLDSKIISLVRVCKETRNYKKLAVVSFILTSNLLNEIGVKLGIRPRNKEMGETLYRYMKLINRKLEDNFGMVLFEEKPMNIIKVVEPLFLKRNGDIDREHVTEMFNTYFDLRKLDVPNLHESYKGEFFTESSDLNVLTAFSSQGMKKSNSDSNKIKPLILHNIREKELSLQKKLRKSYNKDLFENAVYLKKARKTLETQDNKKIEIKGQLKDNLNYQESLSELIGYSLIGIFILFFLLGVATVIEAFLSPNLTTTLSILLLTFFGMSILFLVVYWNYFRKEED